MLCSLKLTCFRKHRDRTFNFGEGLQVIRASNEGGKTTVLEAFGYAIGGATMLNDSLAETVTWGEKPGKLKVEATVEVDGKRYRFVRGNSGAEVYVGNADKPFVTGQSEVSNFAAGLFGADNSVIGNLMIAGQGGLRGALSDDAKGAKGATTLIEKLANLDIIERMLDAAEKKLVIGSPAAIAAKRRGLEDSQGELAAMVEPVAPDEAAFEAEIAQMDDAGAAVLLEYNAASSCCDNVAAEIAQMRSSLQSRETLTSQLSRTMREISMCNESLVAASKRATVNRPDTAAISKKIADAQNAQSMRDAHARFVSAESGGGFSDRVDRKQFDADLSSAHNDEIGYQRRYAELTSRKKVLASQLKGGKCSQCGQDVSHLKELAETARLELPKVEAEIAEVEKLDRENDVAKARLIERKNYDDSLSRFNLFNVECDMSVIPRKFTWIGDVPSKEVEDVSKLKQQLTIAQSTQRDIDAALGEVSASTRQGAALKDRQLQLENQLAASPFVSEEDIAVKVSAHQNLRKEMIALSDRNAALIQERQNLRHKLSLQKQEYETTVKVRDSLQAQIHRAARELKEMNFNAGIVSKLRKARPVIANQLWSMLLSSVSSMFSKIRGEQSCVTRDEKGFKVNGKSATSLSGSAKDVLGLAIRTTLVKTFIPQASFMILDEPAAACDADRTAELVGFVAACGFRQVIMVSHEEISSAVAANVIQL